MLRGSRCSGNIPLHNSDEFDTMGLRAEECHQTDSLGNSMRPNRPRALLLLLLLIVLTTSACEHSRRVNPMATYRMGDVGLALQQQQERLEVQQTALAVLSKPWYKSLFGG